MKFSGVSIFSENTRKGLSQIENLIFAYRYIQSYKYP